MNCFIWILLLLGCGGCSNSYSTWDNSCCNSCNNNCNNNWNGCNHNHGCIQPRNNYMMNRCDNTCNNKMDCASPCNNRGNDDRDCDCDGGCDNLNSYPSARPWGERGGHMSPPPVPGRIREEGCGCDD